MNKLSTAEVHESKLLETLCFLSAVCRLTVTGTWEIQIKNNTGNPLAALNMSQEARFITGYLNSGQTPKEFLEKVIPFEDQIEIQEAFNLALERKSVFSIRHRILQGQAVRIIYQRGEFLHDKDNKEILKMLCICSDITDYQSAFRLSEENEQDFAFITSHKLRAPLSNILALSDLLKNMSVSLVGYDQIKELLLIIGEQAKHLDDAVRRLNKLVFNTIKAHSKLRFLKK